MKIIKILCLMVVISTLGEWSIKALEAGLLTGMTDGMELALNLEALKNKHKYRGKLRSTSNKFFSTKNLEKNSYSGGREPYNSDKKILSQNKVNNSTLDKNLKNNIPLKNENNLKQISEDIPDMPIYFQGWLKYLKIRENPEGGTNKPRQFYKNDLYELQMKPYQNKIINFTETADEFGPTLIPSDLHFFAILYKNTLSILSSRDDTLQRTIDVLNIDDIKPIPDSNNFIGGVRDFGTFSEGSCFRVLSKEPLEPFVMSQEILEPEKGINRKWVFCFDNFSKKEFVMKLLIKLKLKKQHKLGIYVEIDNKGKYKEPGKNGVMELSKDNVFLGGNHTPKDGYWILLQDWSQCTLKCGGGEQYQQLVCVPPKDNGKPCQGPSIRKRPCNTQPCPSIIRQDENKGKINDLNFISGFGSITNPDGTEKKSTEKKLPPVIRMMTISNRPARYDKCHVKEGDALMLRILNSEISNKQNLQESNIPVKIIMNDKTFSIFQDDQMKNLIKTIRLKESAFFRVLTNPRCFILKTKSGEKTQLCQLSAKSPNDWVEEWDYDFNLFKYQCYKPRSLSETAMHVEEEKKLQKEFNKHVDQIKLEIVRKKTREIKKKFEEEEQVTFLQKMEKIKESSFKAIEKENMLERLIEKEEVKKEEEENSEMQEQIEKEEKKKECLRRAIKEKQLEDQFNINKMRFIEKIKEIQTDAKKEIARKRDEIRKKIMDMRKRQGKH
jgi:hypothetical protein